MKKAFEYIEKLARMLPEKLYLLLAPYFAERRIKSKIVNFNEAQRIFIYGVFDRGGFVRARNENEKLLCAFFVSQGILQHPNALRMNRIGQDFVLSYAAQDAISKTQ